MFSQISPPHVRCLEHGGVLFRFLGSLRVCTVRIQYVILLRSVWAIQRTITLQNECPCTPQRIGLWAGTYLNICKRDSKTEPVFVGNSLWSREYKVKTNVKLHNKRKPIKAEMENKKSWHGNSLLEYLSLVHITSWNAYERRHYYHIWGEGGGGIPVARTITLNLWNLLTVSSKWNFEKDALCLTGSLPLDMILNHLHWVWGLELTIFRRRWWFCDTNLLTRAPVHPYN